MVSPIKRFINDLNPTNLRYLFYLVTPNETTYYRVEDVPQFIDRTVSWFIILVLIETTVLLLTGRRHMIALNDSITSITSGIFSQLPKVGSRVISLVVYTYIYENYRVFDVSYDSVWLWVFAFLAQDLAFYLAHRAIHEAGIFWSFHQMHHSSEYYNLTTALRKGCFQEFGTTFFECLQAFITPPSMFITHKALNLLYQFWIHNELIPKLGPLEYILNTPSHHRVHHGRNPYCIDKNYAGVLIIWDRIFGTFEEERPEERPVYGLVENVNTFNPLYLQLFEFKALGWDKPQLKNSEHKDIFPGIWNKIKAVYMPPGYFPGLETKQFFWWRYMKEPSSGIPEV
uniref:Fatty acid hydroxylase domain-containing protein n=1 Tax=Acrobeloides nanus TaxID=290746 RepID=A0A914DSI4_9BILA